MKDSQANDVRKQTVADEARREFIKTAGKIAVTAPAVALLLRASAASAWSTNPYGKDCETPTYPGYENQFTFTSWFSSFFNRS
jgi:hypothetical protein